MYTETHKLKQTLGFFGDPPRVVRGVRSDGLKKLIFIVTLER